MNANAYTNLAAATAAVTNRYVASTDMKVGAYTIANATPPTAGARKVTIAHTTVAAGTDTLGTITIVGKNLAGQTITEVMTPVADSTATSSAFFASVTSATGAGWVIAGGNDTIVIGCAAAAAVADSSGILHSVVVNTTAAGTVILADSKGTIATLKSNIAEGAYVYDVAFSGYLTATLAANSDVTVVHSPALPSSYAMS